MISELDTIYKEQHSIYNKCGGCSVFVREHMRSCPLCGTYIERGSAGDCLVDAVDSERNRDVDDKTIDSMRNESSHPTSTSHYPSVAYPKPNQQYYHNIKVISIINTFIALLTLVCVVVDLLFTRNRFSLYVVASGILVYLTVVYPVNRKFFYFKEVFIDITSLLMFSLFIDFMIDGRISWSVTYVIPVICAAFALGMSIVIVSFKKTPSESLLSLIIVFLFALVFFVVVLFEGERVSGFSITPAFVALVVTAVMLAGMAVFRFGDFVRELFKKLRF